MCVLQYSLFTDDIKVVAEAAFRESRCGCVKVDHRRTKPAGLCNGAMNGAGNRSHISLV